MKTLIVGMGLMGILHGWALNKGEVDVTHKLRPGRSEAFEDGMELDILDTRGGGEAFYNTVYRPKLTENVTPEDGYELVIVPTQSRQAPAAVAEIKDHCPGAQFLLFTANWLGTAEMDELLGRDRYLWGYSACSAGRRDQTIVANLAPVVRLGEWQGSDTPRLQGIVELFGRGGFGPDIKPDIIKWLWEHQAINSGMIGTALYAGGLDALIADHQLMEMMVEAVREGLGVLEARGVDPRTYPDSTPFLDQDVDETVEFYQNWLGNTLWGQRAVEAGHFKAGASEMLVFFSEVYQTAKELDVDTPIMDQINERIGASRPPTES